MNANLSICWNAGLTGGKFALLMRNIESRKSSISALSAFAIQLRNNKETIWDLWLSLSFVFVLVFVIVISALSAFTIQLKNNKETIWELSLSLSFVFVFVFVIVVSALSAFAIQLRNNKETIWDRSRSEASWQSWINKKPTSEFISSNLPLLFVSDWTCSCKFLLILQKTDCMDFTRSP